MSKTILITGASSGFGRDTAETLFRAGHTVYASMRGTQGKNREAAEALRHLGIMTVELDVSDDASVEAGVKTVLAEAGEIDVLVNNAGIGDFESVEKLSPDRFRAVVETNLFGPFYAIHYAAPLMKKGDGGFIVNIGSLAAVNAFAGGAAYNASKFGLLGLSDAAMLDLRHEGIRIAIVLPGSVASEFSHSHRSKESSWMLAVEDVAQAVSDLVRYPDRAIASRLDLRPSRPPRK